MQLQAGYFDALGVHSIWLSPVNENTHASAGGTGGYLYSGYHGYWPDQPRTVDSHWGALSDLQAVTAEAHRHGIRVLLDIVSHQVYQDHPYVTSHPDWFLGPNTCVCGAPNCDWTTYMTDCLFASYLPDVDWTNMTAVDQMVADAMYWLTESDADGFRVDAVKNMPHIASTTLRIVTHQTFENGNAQYYLVGETFAGEGDRGLVESYVSDHELSGQFDYPLYWSITNAYAAIRER